MRRLVGNCPRCGNPIYEGKKAPQRTCMCWPLQDPPSLAPIVHPYVPVPVQPYQPNPWWNPWPTITYGTTTGDTTNTAMWKITGDQA